MADYVLYYWPGIPGRGEFVRLLLEATGQPYRDIAKEKGAERKIGFLLNDVGSKMPPFAPPILVHGEKIIAQSSLILDYLGRRHNFVSESETERDWTRQIQLTIADFVTEMHGCHHPIGLGKFYEDQKRAAKKRAKEFRKDRIPKFLGWFERILKNNSGFYLVGQELSYADLSLFHVIEGIKYAFPNTLKKLPAEDFKLLAAHCRHIRTLPRIAEYLLSERYIGFNESGIFRHYPELDAR